MFYGLDAHKAFIQACELADSGPGRKDYPIGATSEAIEAFAQRLGPADQVVLEATFHTWAIHSILARRAGSVTVANPYEVHSIAKARVKTFRVSTAACLVPRCRVLSVHLFELWRLRRICRRRLGFKIRDWGPSGRSLRSPPRRWNRRRGLRLEVGLGLSERETAG